MDVNNSKKKKLKNAHKAMKLLFFEFTKEKEIK